MAKRCLQYVVATGQSVVKALLFLFNKEACNFGKSGDGLERWGSYAIEDFKLEVILKIARTTCNNAYRACCIAMSYVTEWLQLKI